MAHHHPVVVVDGSSSSSLSSNGMAISAEKGSDSRCCANAAVLTSAGKHLQSICPGATLDECQRFSTSKGGSRDLKAYLTWKELHGLRPNDGILLSTTLDETDDDDSCVWNRAFDLAALHHGYSVVAAATGNDDADAADGVTDATSSVRDNYNSNHSSKVQEKHDLSRRRQRIRHGSSSRKQRNHNSSLQQILPDQPQVMFFPREASSNNNNNPLLLCPSGHCVCYVTPARMQLDKIPPEVYATAISLYLYHYSVVLAAERGKDSAAVGDAAARRRITLVVDTRAGQGWPNAPITKMWSLIRHLSHTLGDRFPGLLHRIVTGPVPGVAVTLWRLVSTLLPSWVTVKVVSGPSTGTSAEFPATELLSDRNIRVLEALRRSCFERQ